jgi:hypothetical protein
MSFSYSNLRLLFNDQDHEFHQKSIQNLCEVLLNLKTSLPQMWNGHSLFHIAMLTDTRTSGYTSIHTPCIIKPIMTKVVMMAWKQNQWHITLTNQGQHALQQHKHDQILHSSPHVSVETDFTFTQQCIPRWSVPMPWYVLHYSVWF